MFVLRSLFSVHGGPGGDLLSHALRRSTIGAEGFHGRVRDGIGWFAPRCGHQTVDGRQGRKAEDRIQKPERRSLFVLRGVIAVVVGIGVLGIVGVCCMAGVLPLHAMAEAGSLFSDFCFLSSD